jgi:predicted amidohydrolase
MAFRVALLQIEPFGLDQSRNLEKGMEQCREAKSLGADLVVFPELWNIGCTRFPMDAVGRQAWTASAIDRRSGFFVDFAALAKELGRRSRVLLGVVASLATRSLKGLAWKRKYFLSVLTYKRFENFGLRSPGGWTIAVMVHNIAVSRSRSFKEVCPVK